MLGAKIKLMNYYDTLWEMIDLRDKIACFLGWGDIIKEGDKFIFSGLNHESYFCFFGMVMDSVDVCKLLNEFAEEGLKLDKDGLYEFQFILSFEKEQTGEFGRVEVPSYWMIEEIIFDYKCSFEDAEKELKLNSEIVDLDSLWQ